MATPPGLSLLKRAFHEIPHFMVGAPIFFGSMIFSYIGIRRQRKYDKVQRRWKRRFTVIREEDYDPKKQVHPYDRVYPTF